MSIEEEIALFDENNKFLKPKIRSLGRIDVQDAVEDQLFLSEAIAFRIYRSYERLVRGLFLHGCTSGRTPSGKEIISKLQCEDWKTAEEILKAGNRFLDWGPVSTKRLADLVFKDGFPMSEVIGPIHRTLIDLQRVRNFIAHDSSEAADGFKKVVHNYLSAGSATPDTAGILLLSRRGRRELQTIRKIFDRVAGLSVIYSAL